MIRNFEIDGCAVLGFDTGFTARAFAQLKFARYMAEPGLIVHPAEAPSQQIQLWQASGVREVSGADGAPTMVVWGPPVEGERLDALLNQSPDKALAALSLWIQAVIALGETPHPGWPSGEGWPPLWPSAAIVAQANEDRPSSVFFAPPALVKHNVTADDELYVNPALGGTASKGGPAAAFTAAAMLYRILAGTPPFSAANISVLHEDMRDGNFLPLHFAVPGLDSRLAALIQAALGSTALGSTTLGSTALEQTAPDLRELLNALQSDGQTVTASSLVHPLPEADRLLLEKEKAQFIKRKTASIKTRRFVARNRVVLLGALAGVVAAIFIVYSMISSRAYLPTTAGMDPVQVIESYYHGFGELDHQMMEACVIGKAGKNDITAVVNFFVMSKTRQAYTFNAPPLIFPAHQWQGGSFPDTPLFGASDLRAQRLEGDESGDNIRYRVDYTFWIPEDGSGEEVLKEDYVPPTGSVPNQRRDFLTLVRKKGNWRIAEIVRE